MNAIDLAFLEVHPEDPRPPLQTEAPLPSEATTTWLI